MILGFSQSKTRTLPYKTWGSRGYHFVSIAHSISSFHVIYNFIESLNSCRIALGAFSKRCHLKIFVFVDFDSDFEDSYTVVRNTTNSIATIIGIIGGIVFLVVVIAIIAVCCCCMRSKKHLFCLHIMAWMNNKLFFKQFCDA